MVCRSPEARPYIIDSADLDGTEGTGFWETKWAFQPRELKKGGQRDVYRWHLCEECYGGMPWRDGPEEDDGDVYHHMMENSHER